MGHGRAIQGKREGLETKGDHFYKSNPRKSTMKKLLVTDLECSSTGYAF